MISDRNLAKFWRPRIRRKHSGGVLSSPHEGSPDCENICLGVKHPREKRLGTIHGGSDALKPCTDEGEGDSTLLVWCNNRVNRDYCCGRPERSTPVQHFAAICLLPLCCKCRTVRTPKRIHSERFLMVNEGYAIK